MGVGACVVAIPPKWRPLDKSLSGKMNILWFATQGYAYALMKKENTKQSFKESQKQNTRLCIPCFITLFLRGFLIN